MHREAGSQSSYSSFLPVWITIPAEQLDKPFAAAQDQKLAETISPSLQLLPEPPVKHHRLKLQYCFGIL